MKPYPVVELIVGTLLCLGWMSTAFPQNVGQRPQTIKIEKVGEIVGEDLKDIVIHGDSLDLGLRPKMLVKSRTVEFIARDGTTKNRIAFEHEIYTSLSANEKYTGIHHAVKTPQTKNELGAGEFWLLKDNGQTLWHEAFPVGWDSNEPIYQISSNGVVCKTDRDRAAISFYDTLGSKMAEHILFHSGSLSIRGEWSQDGSYFAVISPHLRERNGSELVYDDKLAFIDAKGTLIWERVLRGKSANDIRISSRARWVAVSYQDMVSKSFGTTLYSTIDGEPTTALGDIGLTHMIFTQDEERFVAKTGDNRKPNLLLVEAASGRELFRVALAQRIIALKLLEENSMVYILTGERSLPHSTKRGRPPSNLKSQKTDRTIIERPTSEKPEFLNVVLTVLSLNGVALGSVPLPDMTAPKAVSIHSLSTPQRLLLKIDNEMAAYRLTF